MARYKAMLHWIYHYSCTVTLVRLKKTLDQSQVFMAARCVLNSMQPDALQQAPICEIESSNIKHFCYLHPSPYLVSLGQDLSLEIIVPIEYPLIEQSSNLLMFLFINKFMFINWDRLLETVSFSWHRLSIQQNFAGSSTVKQENDVLTLFINLLQG